MQRFTLRDEIKYVTLKKKPSLAKYHHEDCGLPWLPSLRVERHPGESIQKLWIKLNRSGSQKSNRLSTAETIVSHIQNKTIALWFSPLV
jgi:hypothetical protein